MFFIRKIISNIYSILPKTEHDLPVRVCVTRVAAFSVQLLHGRREAARESCEEGGRLARRTSDKQIAVEATKCLQAIKEAVDSVATKPT